MPFTSSSYLDFTSACDGFEDYLHANKPSIESFHPFFESAFWEMVENGGKRFRPKLLLSIVCADAKEQIYNSFAACLAIECLHTYSLIHDDLPAMDNASLRRNHPTLHVRYNEASAILIGDGLQTYAFSLLSNARFSPDVRILLIQCLSYNAGIRGMVLGQALDCEFENILLTEDKLAFIHIHKTANLIAASLKMGAIISNLDLKQQDFLYDFGRDLGLFFQIRDDVIDKLQDEKQAGKTTNIDSIKNSYVNLLGLDNAKSKMEQYIAILQKRLEDFNNYNLCGARQNIGLLLQDYFDTL
ncbi:polyprenyl synthetase family protein [Helicobacter muridarum]|uniref:Geranyltranstransferase n=1 Tax=Helicobacter muridarum TaxID=216 RepID=A0A377PVA0_9HELI|nr:polyprenyl synthetase family protein [Helicobacter muridarum]TLE00746.1 polyprenyl synthetase family protein [Helicobacter muridarum]STQ86575.1 geranyltranstransferase [Helicobacter muridarum]